MTVFPHNYLMRIGGTEIPAEPLRNVRRITAVTSRIALATINTQRNGPEIIMPPHWGAPEYRFVGKQPIVLTIVEVLFLANMVASLGLAFVGKYVIPQNLPNSHVCTAMSIPGIQHGVPDWVCWYARRDTAIIGILLGLLALIFFIFRKDLRRVR